PSGYIIPKANGEAKISAALEGKTTTIVVRVEQVEKPQAVSFANDVVPVFTRSHCNAGACHAKSTGQNGFQLSLLGFDPGADYEMIARQSRGRRANPAAPDHSLILLKASGEIPHEGGARLAHDSQDYLTIRRWIESGLPYHPDTEATVERIEIFPRDVVAQPRSQQQLAVTAFFSDGTTRDITRAVQYEGNQPEMSEADEQGLVRFKDKSGSTSVMVRFQEHITVFMATIPMGGTIAELPQPANFIDEQIFAKLKLLGLPASGVCDDETFLRRVTLDIAGRLPSLNETQAFLASNDADKRSAKVDALLQTTDYADYFAGKWASLLRNKVDRGQEWVAQESYAFHSWIRTSLLANKPYDQFASELILASGNARENPAVSWYRVVKDQKEQMQDIAQVFLGIRMQCAQCHHHPYERWSQDDYFSFAAFFSTLDRKNTPKLPAEDLVFHNRKEAEMENPVTGEKLKPKLLGDRETLQIPAERDPRFELAAWIRTPENPYFARVLVNRYWKHFFSRGLVEPEDDIRPTNPATHPDLLEELTKHFAQSGFDLKVLIRTLCNSRTYQLSSLPEAGNGDDEQNYARFYPRRLPAEVLLDSINDVTGSENSFNQQPIGVRAIALPNEKANKESEFLTMFGRPAMDAACECERTDEANLGQSLHLINSDLIQTKLSNNSGLATTFAKAKDRPDFDRIAELYLRAISREPDAEELAIAQAHLQKKRQLAAESEGKLKSEAAEKQAFEDILWVLINTKEFMFNH
ncbi:MAG: DUF1549 and DUF1553 domain-containing protein, partial [Verrucomicrobiota bacterium]